MSRNLLLCILSGCMSNNNKTKQKKAEKKLSSCKLSLFVTVGFILFFFQFTLSIRSFPPPLSSCLFIHLACYSQYKEVLHHVNRTELTNYLCMWGGGKFWTPLSELQPMPDLGQVHSGIWAVILQQIDLCPSTVLSSALLCLDVYVNQTDGFDSFRQCHRL